MSLLQVHWKKKTSMNILSALEKHKEALQCKHNYNQFCLILYDYDF